MSGVGSLYELADKAATHWRQPRGLVAALTCVVGVVAFLPLDVLWKALAIGGAGVVVLASWLWSRRLPRASRNNVGILLAFRESEHADEQRFSGDFVDELRELLARGQISRRFEIVALPQHIVRKILPGDAAALASIRQRASCAFVLAGRVRIRRHDGRDHMVLDLAGAVGHEPIPESMQSKFSKEFGELLPRRIMFPSDHDLLAFGVTGEWASAVARYVIGIAALLSGDLDYAEELYLVLRRDLEHRPPSNPATEKIWSRLPQRLAEVHAGRAQRALTRWQNSHSVEDAADIKLHIEQVDTTLPSFGQYATLRAISSFVADRDPDAALEWQKRAAASGEGTPYLNAAFLHAFKGNLKKAAQEYRKGALAGVSSDVPAQLEEFMLWALHEYPQKTQIHYCLGLLNRDIKGDPERVREEFQSFIAKCPEGQFVKARQLVAEWLAEDSRRVE